MKSHVQPTTQVKRDLSHLPSLDDSQKNYFFSRLKLVTATQLAQALIQAVLPPYMCELPEVMKSELETLHAAYRANADNPAVTVFLEPAMRAYMETKGIAQFTTLLSAKMIPTAWNSTLIHFLATELKINITQQPVVQATIKDGKVYWQILAGKVVVYDRPTLKNWQVTFTEDNSWLMDWQLFRKFKDAGKRYSPIEISKAQFSAHFTEQTVGESIWDELKAIGILNQKNRLSRSWYIISDVNIRLATIENIKLRTMAATKSLKMQCYNSIPTTLFTLTNDMTLAEKIAVIPGAHIFRPNRTPKKWASTGFIENISTKPDAFCTHRWDVASYKELASHRNTQFEETNYKEKLEYDHCPAKCALKLFAISPEKSYEVQLAEIDQLIVAETNSASLKTRQQSATQSSDQTASDNRIADLTNRRATINEQSKEETSAFGYCVAIPKTLHANSKTMMASKRDQARRTDNSFVGDILNHLDNLKNDPTSYGIDYINDYVIALGALRNLYRTQAKPLETPITGHIQPGRIANGFFKDPKDRLELDKIFINEIKDYLRRC